MHGSTATSSASATAPLTLRVAIWLVLAEAVAMVGLLVYLVYADLSGTATSGRSALLVTVFAATTAAAFAGLGWALVRRRGWARSPTIVLQLLLVPIGWSMAGDGLAWLGVPLVIAGLACAGALAAPSTRAALGLE
jgi:hypothetical protein